MHKWKFIVWQCDRRRNGSTLKTYSCSISRNILIAYVRNTLACAHHAHTLLCWVKSMVTQRNYFTKRFVPKKKIHENGNLSPFWRLRVCVCFQRREIQVFFLFLSFFPVCRNRSFVVNYCAILELLTASHVRTNRPSDKHSTIHIIGAPIQHIPSFFAREQERNGKIGIQTHRFEYWTWGVEVRSTTTETGRDGVLKRCASGCIRLSLRLGKSSRISMQSSKSTGCWQHLATCLLLIALCMTSCRANSKFDDDIYESKGEYIWKPVFLFFLFCCAVRRATLLLWGKKTDRLLCDPLNKRKIRERQAVQFVFEAPSHLTHTNATAEQWLKLMAIETVWAQSNGLNSVLVQSSGVCVCVCGSIPSNFDLKTTDGLSSPPLGSACSIAICKRAVAV